MRRAVAAVALALAAVAACTPQPPPHRSGPPTAVIELLGGPKSATDYSRAITAREITLATGAVRSWLLGRDFGAVPIAGAPVASQSPATYLIGQWAVPDLGIYTFPAAGPVRISRALQNDGPLGQVVNGLSPDLVLAPDHTLFGSSQHDVVQLNLEGTVVDRWPVPTPIPGIYRGPSARGTPDGHTLYGWGVALDSAGKPFVWATNGLNGVLVDLKHGTRSDFPGLGYSRDFGVRADGMAFAIATSSEPLPPGAHPDFCGLASNFCAFNATESVVEFDTRTMRLTATYPMPAPHGELLLSGSTVEVVQRHESYTTLMTLDERRGKFNEDMIPSAGLGWSATVDWVGNVYLASTPSQQYVVPASGGRVPEYQGKVVVYSMATGRTSEAMNYLRPPAGEEVLGLLFRN